MKPMAAAIESYERAFRMQMKAPDAFDISGESEATKNMYGVGQEETDEYGGYRQPLSGRSMEREDRTGKSASHKGLHTRRLTSGT